MITATINQTTRLVVITVRGSISQATLLKLTNMAEAKHYSVLVRFK